ncbi:putative disease resistance protein RGA3 isoform X2 [Malus sylvestris]|uniref:putative disease resistance protein RGA3 isoform X2 n=1 Tax=Malus sylvestris TaxID=3752 RepID=UPI0021ACAB53|nr:putative disease resistance protein RGA3 isoform X2 [Malus sylvestris]XP_050130900.1 putative disease resistance protein RGA3 isoform X2 [Malus sylvestris]XP_050130901.1 putative disease resistance protein RGA3 isoform X2 [Malus sylvestris]
MADALISTLLEKLASTAYEYVAEEVKLVLNVKKEVEECSRNLKAIRAVLEDAEQRQVKEANVRDWLDNLKEISFDMVDVLDDWNGEILRQQVEKQEREGTSAVVAKKKVCFPVVPRCFCCGHVGRVIPRHKIAQEIKDLNERLTAIYKQRKMYNFQLIDKGIQKPQTSSFVDVSEIFGRETEKDSLVRKLVRDEEGRGLLIIPIVGMGGMGKTTLAQLAYNDANVNAHFKKKIWICVSEPFDVMKIAKKIIGDESIGSNELDTVLHRMSRSIEEEKFLLVLNDVWTEDSTQWDQLKVPLMRNSAEGSRILVTTRKERVASMMRSTTFTINLGELGEQHCLSIFNHMAFSNREADEDGVFGDISREIVKKCKGLALVAKTLGSLMRDKRTMKEWKDVLNSKIWDWNEVEEKVFRPLLLSYYDLIPIDRCCLLYCGIFPKDYELERDKLINLWMAQDYLDSEENKDKGIIGNIVFDNLVARSFFQDFKKDYSGKIIGCKMHDIVHDFVHFLTKKECLITEANQGANSEIEVLASKVRHLTLTYVPDGSNSLPTSCYNCKKLRTLAVFWSRSSLRCIDASLVLQLKCLRTLNLIGNSIKELPGEIGQLVHLRHLDLSGNELLEKLPDSICNLYNLYTLVICFRHSLSKLPRNMSKLINLRHLYVANYFGLEYLPKGIGRLTSLQTLDECRVFFGRNDEAFKFGDLRTLNNLRGSLNITFRGYLNDVSEVVELPLVDNKQIFNLRIECDVGGYVRFLPHMTPKSNLQILNALQPQEDLESLGIYGVVAPTWPKWLTCLNRLRFLTLGDCRNWETLPPLGKLPFLERLELLFMGRIEKVGGEFLGLEDDQAAFKSSSSVFPKLKDLCFERIWAWKKWEGVSGWTKEDSKFPTIMPCLSSLTIQDCPDLKTLPDFLSKIPLQNLTIKSCWTLYDRCTEASGEEWPKISHIQKIIRESRDEAKRVIM